MHRCGSGLLLLDRLPTLIWYHTGPGRTGPSLAARWLERARTGTAGTRVCSCAGGAVMVTSRGWE